MTPEVTNNQFVLQHQIITMPIGLPAFETVNDYMMIANEEEEPFIWLQSTENKSLAFITIDPFLICPSYLPDIPNDDISFLEIEKEEDAFILSIVNINNPDIGTITANLVSPLVINWKTCRAKQAILQNHHLYSVRHIIDPQE